MSSENAVRLFGLNNLSIESSLRRCKPISRLISGNCNPLPSTKTTPIILNLTLGFDKKPPAWESTTKYSIV